MPSEGVELSPPQHILSDDEVIRLATLFVKSGVTKIRLTGGEPTVRKSIVDIVGLYSICHNVLQTMELTSVHVRILWTLFPNRTPPRAA